jgi:hypothetical protein
MHLIKSWWRWVHTGGEFMRTAVPLMTLAIEMSCDMCCIVYSMFIFLHGIGERR